MKVDIHHSAISFVTSILLMLTGVQFTLSVMIFSFLHNNESIHIHDYCGQITYSTHIDLSDPSKSHFNMQVLSCICVIGTRTVTYTLLNGRKHKHSDVDWSELNTLFVTDKKSLVPGRCEAAEGALNDSYLHADAPSS